MDVGEMEALRAENADLRRQAAELSEERERLRRLVQATIDQVDAVIYLRDETGVFTFVNETYVRVTHLPREAVLGKRDSDVFPREVYESFRVADRQAVETRRSFEQEESLPQADGVHVFRSVKFPVLGADGSLVALGGISTDLTEQRRAEATLQKTRSILQAVIDNAPLVILASNAEGRYILVSSEAARQIGRPVDEILGRLDREILPPEVAAIVRAESEAVFRTGQSLSFEQALGQPPRTYLTTKFPIRDASGAVYAAGTVAAEITDLRDGEAERMRLKEEIIRAQEFALQELSTPIIPIADGALAVPIIGTIDRERMRQVVGTLLRRIADSGASVVILDVTGIRQVEAETMNALLQATHAIRLLGVETVLTGVQPDMARTMVSLGVALHSVTTLQTLQHGIEYALARLRRTT